MITDEIADRHQELFDKYADAMRDLALREIAGGNDLGEFALLLFDMGDPVTVRLVREFIPDLDPDDIEPPPGHDAVICASCSAEDAINLAQAATDLAESLRLPLPEGSINTLTLTEGSIFHFHLFLIPSDRPAD